MANVFEGSKQAELYINIEAGKVYQFEAPSGFNTALIFNPDLSDTIYCDLQPDVSAGRFIASAAPLSWGIVVDPFRRNKLYLYSASGINNIRIKMLTVDDPVILLNSQLQAIASSDVSVVSTVGLKKADIAVDATTKAILTELDPAAHFIGPEKGLGTNDIKDILVDDAAMFGVSGNLGVLTTSASNTLDIISTTKDIDIIQVSFRDSGLQGVAQILEGVTHVSGGSAASIISTNRTGTPPTPTATARIGSTLSGGVIIYDQPIAQGELSLGHFFRLKKNVLYSFKITNYASGSSRAGVGVAFREVG